MRVHETALKPPEDAVLFRVSWLQHTVRYEWYDAKGDYFHGPVFTATAQEWERALD